MSSEVDQEKPTTVEINLRKDPLEEEARGLEFVDLLKHFGMNYSESVRKRHPGCRDAANKYLAEIKRRIAGLEAERDRIKARHDSMLEALKRAEAGLFLASGGLKEDDGRLHVAHCLRCVEVELEKAEGKK